MATLINGINGHFSGKVGNVVGSSWNGKNYIKSAPLSSAVAQRNGASPVPVQLRRPSQKQLAQQARFALAVRFLHPVKDLLSTSFKKHHKAATGYNLAVKYILEHAITGNYPYYAINYPEVAYTQGILGQAEHVEVLAEGGSLLIGWFSNGFRMNSYEDDQVNILVYEPETNTYLKGPSGIVRSEGIATVPIPEAWRRKTLHTYVYCVSRDGKYSNTVYAGPVRNLY